MRDVPIPVGTFWVYRLFNSGGDLLYVGKSNSPGSRLRDHMSKAWGHQISYYTKEPFATEHEALLAEDVAIRTERPLYNKEHQGGSLIPSPPNVEDPKSYLIPSVRDKSVKDSYSFYLNESGRKIVANNRPDILPGLEVDLFDVTCYLNELTESLKELTNWQKECYNLIAAKTVSGKSSVQ